MFNIMEFVDVEEVLEELRTSLLQEKIYLLKDKKLVNNNIMITCPYHESASNGQLGMEENPSMGISLKDHNTGVCHCFNCGKTVSFPELVSNVFGKQDGGIYGVKWLHQKYDFISEENRKTIDIIPIEKVVDLTPVAWESLSNYETTENIDYLDNRGISKFIQTWFNIKFDPISRHIIFPMTNKNGQLLYIQSRSVDVKFFFIQENAPKAHVLFGLDKVVEVLGWKDSLGVDVSKLYVVESAIDAMYLWGYGKMAVATSQAIPTDEQLALIKKLPIKVIVAAQDNDSAGWVGAHTTKNKLTGKLVYRFNAKNHNYKDMNDLPPSEIIDKQNLSLVW